MPPKKILSDDERKEKERLRKQKQRENAAFRKAEQERVGNSILVAKV